MHSLIADQRINAPSELLLLRGYEIVVAKKPTESKVQRAGQLCFVCPWVLKHPDDLIEGLLQALA
jgi:hypothetical protein